MSDFPELEHLIATPTVEGLTCHMHFRGGWHKIGETPDYGVSAARMMLAVQGEHGAVSAEINTGWHLSRTYEVWDLRGVGRNRDSVQMTAREILLHSPHAWSDDDDARDGCLYVPGVCHWRDAFNITKRDEAERAFCDALIGEGMRAAYAWLARVYRERIETRHAEMVAYAGVSL